MQCPDCGAYIGKEDQFCGECGRPIAREATAAPTPYEVKDQVTEVVAPRQPAAPPPRPQPAKRDKSRLAVILAVLAVGLALVCTLAAGLLIWVSVDGEDASTPVPAENQPPPGGTIYVEGFEDPDDGWGVYNNGDTIAVYADSQYRVGVFRDNYVAWGNPEPPLDLADFEIEVDARQVEGPLDNNLGLLVRYQEGGDDFYWFQISSDGYYSVDLMRDGEWETLVGWQESTAIFQGLDVVNRLRLVCNGDTFDFYVNGTYLVTVEDDTYASGNIGLSVGTFDEPGVVVHFDNLEVQGLSE
jgi:hypothetical protein